MAPIGWSRSRASWVRSEGIYGAKITGGGSGGTVAILGDRDQEIA